MMSVFMLPVGIIQTLLPYRTGSSSWQLLMFFSLTHWVRKIRKLQIVYAISILMIFIFIYVSLTDGIDGKQARRTQTCGPLGELFDHGLDSWSTMFITTALYSVFGM